MNQQTNLNLNARTQTLVESLLRDADALRIRAERDASGVCIIDAGIGCPGGIEAGRRIAEICMGALGTVRVDSVDAYWPLQLTVASSQPALSCLASQYAGWSLAHGEGKGAWFGLGSGPARALAAKEELFAELGYKERHGAGTLVLEVEARPPQPVLEKVLRDCALDPQGLTVILTPTRSLAGTTQVVARVLEVALHKAHTLGFDPRLVIEGVARAPLPAPGKNFLAAMARTNDAILYGGHVHLLVDCEDAAARDLCARMPSSTSREHGRSFGDLFRDAQYDFYKLDANLFAPASVHVSNLRSGATFRAGAMEPRLLEQLWSQD